MSNEKTARAEHEISVMEFLKAIWSKKFLIIALIILGMALMFVKTQFLTSDTYTSSGKLLISNRTEVVKDKYYINQGDILSARYMSETYIEILRTRDFLEKVEASLGGRYSWEEIDRMVECTIINETEVLQITVDADSAEGAEAVGQAYMENAKTHLVEVYDGCEVEIVDRARIPERANDKGMVINLVIGMFAGVMIGILITFLILCFDTKVRKSEDVAKRYRISILGELAD